MKTEDARALIEAFKEENGEAYRLALAASLAVRVEPELVRALRLCLFPGVDAGAEADLWFSPLVRSQTPLALEFERNTLELLRRDLAADPQLLHSAWEVIEEFHAGAPYALRLEEELTWLGLVCEDNEAVIEERLQAALARLRAGRAGIARWASRALKSLPEKARSTEAALKLSLAAGMRTGVGPVLDAIPSGSVAEAWLNEFSVKQIARVNVGVRLLKNESADTEAAMVNAAGTVPTPTAASTKVGSAPAEPPMLVEFSYPPASVAEVVEVPDTYRLLLEISWMEDDRRRLRQLSLLPEETRRVPVGYGDVAVRTALGDIFTIRPRFDYDFLLLYHANAEKWARTLVQRLEEHNWNGKRLKVATSSFDSLTEPESDLESLKSRFGLSRKVGFVISGDDDYSDVLMQLESSRPEPWGRRGWLIQISRSGIRASFSGGSPVVEFRDGAARFEDGLRDLWRAITGEQLPTRDRQSEATQSVEVFYSYSHQDEKLLQGLVKQLENLKRQGVIADWHDKKIGAGQEWEGEIDERLNSAQVILLLISESFMASDYCNDVEVKRAMERHHAKDARVIPILLRAVDWKGAPFSKLQFLPSNAKPVTGWANRDKAFEDVAKGIRAAVEELSEGSNNPPPPPPAVPTSHIINFVRRYDKKGHDILERLKEELAPEHKSLVVLWGKGGVGKTRLASEAASALTARFGQRIVWASAEKRTDFTFSILLDEIAKQLEQPDLLKLAQEPKAEAVAALLATAPTLVVLDNFETVASEDERVRCTEFLMQQAKCSSLITTRQRVASARSIPITGMTPKETQEFLEQAIEQTQEPDNFTKQVRNRIIKTAEANPYLMLWVVGQIDEAKSPRKVFDELEGGQGQAAERVFDRSFNLPQLGDDGRATLLALSLFVPSAARPALAAVAGFGDNQKRLNEAVKNLHALWLIKGLDANRRFTIEGLTRSLAAARLAKDERAEEFRQRFVAYFLDYAEAHAQPTPEDYGALETEKNNILSAMDVAFALHDWESVLRLVSAINRDGVNGLLTMHGYWDEAIRRGHQAIEAARNLASENAIAIFTHNTAIMHLERGELIEARRLYNESLEISKKLGDQSGIAQTLSGLGRLAQDAGKVEEARRLYGESMEISRRLGHKSGVADNLQGLGRVARELGEVAEAQQRFNESLTIYRHLDSQRSIAGVLHQLGLLAAQEGDKTEAVRLARESLRILEKIGSPDAESAREALSRLESEAS